MQDTVLSEVRQLAETALRQPDVPASVLDALRRIVALADLGTGDTPEASDTPQTENQTL